MVHTICDILDEVKPKAEGSYRDQITSVADRPGHDMRYAIDASKIQKELRRVLQETFESAIKKTLEWYLNNEVRWKALLDGSYQGERLDSA
ncbi:hypothetical protein AltI4_07640 [Alteromonas sp. I4]|nr:hypothetical protein AltI4_07640 [Alteromonas sp. I4]